MSRWISLLGEWCLAFKNVVYLGTHLITVDHFAAYRFYELQEVHGRVEPLAEVDLSPPRYADVRVIFNDLSQEQLENDELCYESLVRRCKNSRLFKVDLNKSVRNFKTQLG